MIDTSAATAPTTSTATQPAATENLAFASLGLAEPILRAVAEMGYTQMSPIQAAAIPVVLTGRDVMGAAQTGTGKTAAFTLPLLQRMMPHANHSASPARHPVRALVLAPTRELADQVAQNVAQYAKHTPLRSAVVFGGMDMKPQVAQLRQGVEVLVAIDVAARGLDIKDVPAVFNYDLPFHAEDYVHRIGRTGRAGASGLAISLVSPTDGKLLAEIEKTTKQSIQPEPLQVQGYRRERSDRTERSDRSEGYGRYERSASREPSFRREREDDKPQRGGSSYRPQAVSRDPFFNKPYEAAERSDLAAWEKTGKTPVVSNRGAFGNIRSKRKVAALFKAV